MENKNININSLDKADIAHVLCKKVALCYGANNIPFRIIENKYFIVMIDTCLQVDPDKVKNFKLPTRQTLSSTLIPSVQADLDLEKKNYLKTLMLF